jgi:RIO kinase 1
MYRSQGGNHLEQLEEFFDQGFIVDVLGLVKTGKEASVYCCRGGSMLDADLAAAKVYRARQYRFKNDAVYQESRVRELGIRGSARRAFEKRRKSDIGRQVQSHTWIHHEIETLETLYEAGADVPKPYASGGDAILMEFFGDEDEAAPQLNRVLLAPEEAGALFERIIENIELFLSLNRVHGDLSPHNILYHDGRVRIIDFPQSVDPRFNRNARDLLERDVANVCRYFADYGVEASPDSISHDLWRRFTYGLL